MLSEGVVIRQIYLILVAHSLCLCHQISLCTGSQYAVTGKEYVRGLLCTTHLLCNSMYMRRIWVGAVRLLLNCQVYTRQQASEANVNIPSRESREHFRNMRYLVNLNMYGLEV